MENLVRGKENKTEVLNRLNLKSETLKMSYVNINGIPHRPNAKGEIVPLKLIARRYMSSSQNNIVSNQIEISEQLNLKGPQEQFLLAS